MREVRIIRKGDRCPDCGEVEVALRQNRSTAGFFMACPRRECDWTGPPDSKDRVCRICERRFSRRVGAAHLRQHGYTPGRYVMLIEGSSALRFLRRQHGLPAPEDMP